MATKPPNSIDLNLTGVNPDEIISRLVEAYGSSDEVAVEGFFNYEWFMYLLQRWETVTIYIINPILPPKTPSELIKVKGGWTIHDYGNKLVISRGEEWPAGHITQGNMLSSLKAMITVLLGKNNGQTPIDVDAIGFPLAVRAAWLIFYKHQINVRNYAPTERDWEMLTHISEVENGNKPKGSPELQR